MAGQFAHLRMDIIKPTTSNPLLPAWQVCSGSSRWQDLLLATPRSAVGFLSARSSVVSQSSSRCGAGSSLTGAGRALPPAQRLQLQYRRRATFDSSGDAADALVATEWRLAKSLLLRD